MTISELNNFFGDMDLFLLDLILKGKIHESDRILDAGCGSGRNSLYFLNQRFDIKAIDNREAEVKTANFMSRSLAGKDMCILGDLIQIPFEAASFDLIICSRVLHFSDCEKGFKQMLTELKRVLAPTGMLYLSMASQIGFDEEVEQLEDGKAQFRDGSIRFVLTRQLLNELEKEWKHVELPRTILFDQEHAETTLVLAPT